MRIDAESERREKSAKQPTNDKMLKVLLVGKDAQGSSYIVNRLWQRGCECEFAASYEEVRALIKAKDIYLVLCPMWLNGRNLLPLVDLLEGSRVSLFYAQSLEQGCWWLPALRQGRKCLGSCAVRPSEFISVLDEVIDAGRPRRVLAPDRIHHQEWDIRKDRRIG